MENFLNEIEIQKESKVYTPESLAWDLLVGDVDPEKRGLDETIEFFSQNNNDDKISKSDSMVDKYQILITIFMELLFGLAKLNFYAELEKSGGDVNKKFIPKYKKFNFETYFSLIEDKMSVLGFICNLDIENPENLTEESKEDLIKMINDRYCRIILRYNDNDDYFKENDVPEDVYYHMIINGLNKKQFKKLNEIYSIINLNGKVYKISFNKL
jgi:hypothetical protein